MQDGQVGVGLVLHDRAQDGTVGVQHRRRGLHGDRLGLRADGEHRAEVEHAQTHHVQVLLLVGLEALEDHRYCVGSRRQRRDGIETIGRGGTRGREIVGNVGGRNHGARNERARAVLDRTLDSAFAGGLRHGHMGCKQRG